MPTDLSPSGSTIQITGIDKSIGPDKLLTFYLVLPALESAPTRYILKMTVTNKSGTTFVKTFGANTGRNRITPLPAICIESWGGGGTSSINLVGSGTEIRPFMIYDDIDLQKVKAAFDNVDVVINGQAVTEETWFKLARTDIVLTTENWTEGINNFKGIMEGSSNSPIEFGVTNKSNAPLFESITSEGVVRYIYAHKAASDVTYTGSKPDFSPICGVNNGLMVGCHNRCNYRTSAGNLAGLCVTNNGEILRCLNSGNLTATGKKVGGICLYNNNGATIQQCVGIASSRLSATHVGGVCLHNKGLIYSCNITFNNNIDSSKVKFCGGVAMKNFSTGKINLCRIFGDLTVSKEDELGGIADTNMGIIDSCFLADAFTMMKAGRLGGMAAVNSGSSAYVINSYVIGHLYSNGTGAGCYAGGIVGYLDGGNIENCFAACNITGSKIASILSQGVSGNVNNCYTYGSSETYGKIYREVSAGVNFNNCYTSIEEWPDRVGCEKFVHTTGLNEAGTAFLLDILNSWCESNNSPTGKPYSSWNTVLLPKFNY